MIRDAGDLPAVVYGLDRKCRVLWFTRITEDFVGPHFCLHAAVGRQLFLIDAGGDRRVRTSEREGGRDPGHAGAPGQTAAAPPLGPRRFRGHTHLRECHRGHT